MSELKTIANQVSLLNRLIELLMMQEDLDFFKDEDFATFGIKRDHDNWTYLVGEDELDLFSEAWNHPITQKAWSDELVKVARKLKDNSPVHLGIASIVNDIGLQDCLFSSFEAILNKHGRSLSG